MFFKRQNKTAFYDRHWLVCLGGILLLALGLRLINISAEPFWADEILSLDIVTKSAGVGEMLRYLAAVEFHPPLFYLVMTVWTGFVGASEFAARSLSVIFSLGTIVIVYATGIRMFRSRAVGLLSALLMAVLPIQIEFGQEARPYAMMCFFAVAAMLLLWEHLQKRRFSYAVGYVICSLVGVYLHYSFSLFVLALAGWWFVSVLRLPRKERSRDFVYWLAAHAAMFLGFLPWLVPFLHKIFVASFDIYGLPRRTSSDRPSYFVEGVLNQLVWLNKEKTVLQIELLAITSFKLLLAWVLVVFIRASGRMKKFADGEAVMYLLWVVVVTLVLFAISPQSMAYSKIFFRHVILVTMPLALLFAGLVVGLPLKKGALIMVMLLVTLVPSVGRIVANDAHWDYDFKLQEAAQLINENYKDGDLVIVYVVSIRTDLAHYLKEDIPITSLLPTSYYGQDVLSDRHRLGIVENEMQVRIEAEPKKSVQDKLTRLVEDNDHPRVWLFMVNKDDYAVHDWFDIRGWRHAITNSSNIFVLDMYSRE